MDSKAYQEHTRRTRAPNTNIGRGLFTNDLEVLRQMLDIVHVGSTADAIKRSLFYRDPKVAERLEKATQAMVVLHEAMLGREKNLEADPLNISEKDFDLLHAIVGKVSEVGELAQEFVEAYLQKRPIDVINVKEELGDDDWYGCLGLDWAETDHSTVWDMNIAKLSTRYPEKFKKSDALDRDTDAERKALEDAA